ncbi:MAG: carboxypeptidase regulatory-like domain-containing protein, partial [Candidatus Cloacimonetes bacterium]|nr:carboxypeptidase regulatory-like domain-containing protein [Candidatus Cloacimonadota bacterium]
MLRTMFNPDMSGKSRIFSGEKTLVITILLGLFLVLPAVAGAQIAFERWYGGAMGEEGYSVAQTDDGGYIITGWTHSYGAGCMDVYLIKTDASGDTLWTKTFGGTSADCGRSVARTQDGGYIITGYTYSYGAGSDDVYLVKTDSLGDTLWTKTFGGTNCEEGRSVAQTDDGGYIITGHTTSYGAGGKDVYLIKTDASGNTLWTKTFGGTGDDEGRSVSQTNDGGYIIAGYISYSYQSGDVYLIKTDALGNTLWTRTFGGTVTDLGYSGTQTDDGGYIITGNTYSYGGCNVYLIKTDASGDTLWTKTFGGTGYNYGYSVTQTDDGGYIIAGYTEIFGPGWSDVYLIKTDASGNTLWTRTFGGTDYDRGFSVAQTDDGGYIIAGYTATYGAGLEDVYLIKTDENGLVGVGNLDGTVTNANNPGESLDDVLVTVSCANGPSYTATTNENGYYLIQEVVISEYTVTFEKEGYNVGLVENVEVFEDQTTTVDYAMTSPTMEVDPLIIDEQIAPDSSLTTYITVSNNGTGPLIFNISISEEQDRAEFHVSPREYHNQSHNNYAPIESSVSGWYSVANKPGDINSRLDEWYTYGDINSLYWITWAAPERVTYFDPADFGLNYPFNITKINHWFYEHPDHPWDDATFHFKIYEDDGVTLLYESGDIEAEHMIEIVHDITEPVNIESGGFYFGVAPVSSSGLPSTSADYLYTGTNHSYFGSPGNWTLWSQSPNMGEFIQSVYLISSGIISWMTVDPAFDTVEPSESVQVAVTLDATGLELGTVKTAEILFTSTPDVGTLTIPVTMHVTGPGQQLSLGENWNWISFNVHPDDTSIDSVFAPLTPDDIHQVMNQTQSATYYDPPGTWYGSLEEITDGEGYLVEMNNFVNSFIVVGMQIDPSTPIALNVPWNWIAYYPQYTLQIEDALSSIVPNVYQVMNQTQSATYYDPPGQWYGSLEQMEPNVGYKVKMNATDTLIYPGQRAGMIDKTIVTRNNIKEPRNDTKDPPDWEVIQNTQCHMVLMAEITLDEEEFEGTDNNLAGAFCWIDSLQ